MGVGGGFLAALFAAEAYVLGGFAIIYGVAAFIMIGMCARFFGMVKVWEYCAVVVVFTAVLLAVGLPK